MWDSWDQTFWFCDNPSWKSLQQQQTYTNEEVFSSVFMWLQQWPQWSQDPSSLPQPVDVQFSGDLSCICFPSSLKKCHKKRTENQIFSFLSLNRHSIIKLKKMTWILHNFNPSWFNNTGKFLHFQHKISIWSSFLREIPTDAAVSEEGWSHRAFQPVAAPVFSALLQRRRV